jgi:hypothetical protein
MQASKLTAPVGKVKLWWAYCTIHSFEYLYSSDGRMGCPACTDAVIDRKNDERNIERDSR